MFFRNVFRNVLQEARTVTQYAGNNIICAGNNIILLILRLRQTAAQYLRSFNGI